MEQLKQRSEQWAQAEPSQAIGERALWGAGVFKRELGVNDPLTHLEQQLEDPVGAMDSIDRDLIHDLAERMQNAKFKVPVAFDRVGNDFISRENQFSMRDMTDKTKDIFASNVIDMKEYQRAKIESKEVARLNDWFETAPIGDLFVVESLPLGDKERYTIVRIYEKTGIAELVEHIITLHNSTVGIFNQLHLDIGVTVPESHDELALLDNMYSVELPEDTNPSGFIDGYIDKYDAILAVQNPGQQFSFGLEKAEGELEHDDIQMIRAQTGLRKVYTDLVRALGDSGGYMSEDIIELRRESGLDTDLEVGMKISSGEARGYLATAIQYLAATLNEASAEELKALAASGDSKAAYDTAGSYGAGAAEAGRQYDGACPTSTSGAAAQEAAALAHGHRKNQDPTKCVECRDCHATVDLPEELYKQGIYHCVKCKATYDKHGPVDYEGLMGVKKVSILDEFTAGLRAEMYLIEMNDLLKQQDQAADEFTQRRLKKRLRELELGLHELQLAA